MTGEIYFYRNSKNNKYGCFSNFSNHWFELDDKIWPTSEHYFQASKFPNTKFYEQIQRAKTPAKAFSIGRDRKLPLRADWNEMKEEVMSKALEAKFRTHTDLYELLVNTGDALIVENSPRDAYWGIGRNKNGKNRLGVLLMKLRSKLQDE